MSTFHMGTATQVRIGFELIFTSNQPSYIHAGRIILLYMTSQQSKQIYATCDYNGTYSHDRVSTRQLHQEVAGDYFSQEVYHLMQTRKKNCVSFWCSDYSMTALIHLDEEKPLLALNPHWYLFTAISSHLKYKFNIAGSWSWVKTPVASRVEIWSLIWVGSRSNSGYCAHVNVKAQV